MYLYVVVPYRVENLYLIVDGAGHFSDFLSQRVKKLFLDVTGLGFPRSAAILSPEICTLMLMVPGISQIWRQQSLESCTLKLVVPGFLLFVPYRHKNLYLDVDCGGFFIDFVRYRVQKSIP
jgi:hypothetical protein